MRHSLIIAGVAVIAACAASLASAAISPASAGGWHRWDGYAAPRHYSRRAYRIAPRAYDGGVRYYNNPRGYRDACSYGDCACFRGLALRTGNPTWWDKYQACSGN
jgi:hypothetical protein